jgi:amino acid transporter
VPKFFSVFVCVSIFDCGLVIMVTNSRLIWAMARVRRLPGHQLWAKFLRSTRGPSWANALAAVIGIVIILPRRATQTLSFNSSPH